METTTMTKRNESPERVNERPAVAPACDVFENADELLLVADVPGVAKEAVSIQLDKGTLTVEAKRGALATGTLLAGDSRVRDFVRVFTVPAGIDGSRIEAELRAGVLRVRLPKSEKHKPRRIEVRAGS